MPVAATIEGRECRGELVHVAALSRYLLDQELRALDSVGHRTARVGLHRRDSPAHKMTALQVGGVEDHIHALVTAPATIAPAQIAQYLKGDSSKWIHDEFRNMRGFSWQDGYGAFTVSKSNLPEVVRYIKNQREHHRKRTFQEEYLEFLQKHGIEYDERHLWGVIQSSLTRRMELKPSIGPGLKRPG